MNKAPAVGAGRDGRDGRDGKAGEPGKDGKHGQPGRAGRNGLDGRAGEKGDQGAPGDNGIDAMPPEPWEAQFIRQDGSRLTDMVEVKSASGALWRLVPSYSDDGLLISTSVFPVLQSGLQP